MRTLLGVALATMLATSLAPMRAPSPVDAQVPTGALRTIITRSDALLRVQRDARGEHAGVVKARARLLREAKQYAALPMVAVTDKKRVLPPSGDAHDYYSLSPYWWPDPTKADGLPYIRRDGETNPESKRDLDQPRVSQLGERVQAFTLAWWLTGDRTWSDLAMRQVRTWFVDPATRMTPHLRFAQLVRGNPQERGSGIIDTRSFIEVVDAIGMLERAPGWTAADGDALREWFRHYNSWLLASPNGTHERAAQNNHGSWYAAQTASYALFVGDTARARDIVTDAKDRIARQIRPDGTQPEEMARTRSMHYHNFNLEALSRVAEIGRTVGVDLWSYTTPTGVSLRSSVEMMVPFVGKTSDWPGTQIDDVNVADMLRTMRRARLALGTSAYDSVIESLPPDMVATDRSLLLFWSGT
ncbi:MAG: alginate lyase family protein [Gemmatimonadaceae bacterium]|nr:alginate lyase family protein [Gemmatimonadaceae bacterium]